MLPPLPFAAAVAAMPTRVPPAVPLALKNAFASVPVAGKGVALEAPNVTLPEAGTPPVIDHPGAAILSESRVRRDAPHAIPDDSDAMFADPMAERSSTTGTVSLPLGMTTAVGEAPNCRSMTCAQSEPPVRVAAIVAIAATTRDAFLDMRDLNCLPRCTRIEREE
jgi:hypothetical protein